MCHKIIKISAQFKSETDIKNPVCCLPTDLGKPNKSMVDSFLSSKTGVV